ncbi:GFA family protein [Pararhizobium sp. BT-229]|uniref:GFA family protein n=1 Tax=Pararhizobium sp. BT-229 TaxID=2986923 RepID=UPI0021F758FD|nr:GFA family protein [Pararhizobium sp. BT-229]MCV9967810.1 GFA family protein [Pararhizobium sp. BT-229]
MSRVERGACFWGAIEAEAVGKPFGINWDHDQDCRKAIGSPMMIWIGYRSEQLICTAGQPKTFSKTRGVTRSFCGDCGSCISYQDAGLPSEIYLCIAFMDAPERFEPSAHGNWEERLLFVEMSDRLPREARYTRPRQPALGLPRDR